MQSFLRSRPRFRGYSDSEPLEAYALLTGVGTVGLVAALSTAGRRRRLPDGITASDVVLLGLATHKVARLLTKDSVTSFLRAPFVHLEEKSGTNSLEEEPRGEGIQRAIGELVSCPECTGHWVASGLLAGFLHAPRLTRTVCGLYSALTLADFLQFAYAGVKTRA